MSAGRYLAPVGGAVALCARRWPGTGHVPVAGDAGRRWDAEREGLFMFCSFIGPSLDQ